MLPLAKIYIDNRRGSNAYESSSDCKTDLPVNITLPPNAAFYINDITIPVRWYTVEAGIQDTLYFRINGPAFSASKSILPE